MKIGDRLYCINDYISVGKIVNTKGQTYKIISVQNFNIIIETNYKNDNGCDKNQFILGSTASGYNLYEFFIDLNEERKLKIKKIENR